VMLAALLYFLLGALVLLIVLYVARLVLAQMELPPNVRQIALLIIGLVGLILLLTLVLNLAGSPVRL
jgi:predicted transporter